MSRLHLQPITFAEAAAFVEKHHRHHPPSVGWKYGIAVSDSAQVRGVVMVGRPVARHLDDGLTLEVTRCCTDGTKNAASMLYGAAWRAAKALGYQRLISTKSIAIEENVMQSYAADVGRELGGELLFVHGRLMCHVTPQVAKAMRRRFRETKGLTPRTPRPTKHTPPKRCTVCGQLFHRRRALAGEPGYESPGQFKQRKTCGPDCHQKQSRRTRYGTALTGMETT